MSNSETEIKVEKKMKVPHVYIILLAVVVICAILTYFVPAGEYAMIEGPGGRMVVDPTSYHEVDQTPLGVFDVLKSIPKGMVEVASIIFFIFIVGGSFAVVQGTGAIEAGIGALTKKMAGKERAIIPVIMIAFSLGGAVFGMAEETLPFIPIMVTLCIALGFDSLTGAGIVLIGAGAKVLGSIKIGDDSKIGAGSVVLKDVPENSTVVGIPGRIIQRAGERIHPELELSHSELPDPIGEALQESKRKMREMEERCKEYCGKK